MTSETETAPRAWGAAPDKGGAHPYVVLFLLTLVYGLNAVDRQLVAILAEPIRKEFNLADGQLGLLTGFAFAIFYTVFGIPLAWLADRTRRVWLVAAACSLWSLFTIFCGMSANFLQLSLARVGVAIGEAGGSPPSYSIVSDYFPPEKRGAALAVLGTGVPIGMAASVALGGWAAAHYGWRSAFVASGIFGLVVAVVLVIVLREPRRGRMDVGSAPVGKAPPLWSTTSMFVRDPVLSMTTLAASLSVFASHGITAWMPAFLLRSKGMTLTEMAAYYSVVTGVSMVIGTLLSGFLADKLSARRRWLAPLIPGVTLMIALPMIVATIWAPTWQAALLMLAIPMISFWMYLPVALLVIQNGVAANQRATCSSLLLFSVGIVGQGGGATYVGYISDWAKANYGAQSLHVALMALVPIFLLATGCHVIAALNIRRREKALAAA